MFTKIAILRFVIALMLVMSSCSEPNDGKKVIIHSRILQKCNRAIREAVVIDRVTPPVSGRRYFFASVAAYEALVPFYPTYKSTAGQFRELTTLPTIDTSMGYCLDLAALTAHTSVSSKLVYNADSINSFKEKMLSIYKSKLNSGTYNRSISWGQQVAEHILNWAKTDSFGYYRGNDDYLYSNEPGAYQSTAPDNSPPVEPNWNKIRTSLVPNFNTIKIEDPEPYSSDKNSRFYAITKQVYDQVKNQDSAQYLSTANYWDDSPNTTEHIGHIEIHKLKISPAGHWLAQFTHVANQQNLSLIEIADGYVRASAVIHDAFILCWDTKYRTNYIRPQTAIRRFLDSAWLSPIQTPPFPEYPSGHSVVSGSASGVLQNYFGAFKYTDSSEYEYGFGVRTFNSFVEAANQACISRLYGGIHFIDAIEKGKKMGVDIAKYHLTHLVTNTQKHFDFTAENEQNKGN